MAVLNTIFWNNSARIANEVYFVYHEEEPCTVLVAYTNVNTEECYIETDAGLISWSEGNINVVPLFISPTDFRLQAGSPCIDAGAEFVLSPWGELVYAPSIDVEGNSRPWGVGWDIGAYEYCGEYVRESYQNPQNISLSAFPNPFNSSVTITTPAGAEIKIYDLLGNCVWSKTIPQSAQAKLVWQPDERLPSGVYLVKASCEGKCATRKLIYLK